MIATSLGDRALEAQACYSLGNTYTLLQQYERSVEYHMRHLHIARELSDRVGEARACWSLGNAYSALQRTDLALHYTTLHLDISRQVLAASLFTLCLLLERRLYSRGLEVKYGITNLQRERDPIECGFYRGIKLLEHAMKVVERIFKNRIWQQIDIDDMQFGYMKGKRTTDAIFIVRQMQEKFKAKGKKLYFGFVDLEKAFDRVPTEVIRWAVHKLGVEEWLVSAVMSMYTGAKTVVRTVDGNSNDLEVKVDMHQGSALSPLLFVIVMEALFTEYRVALSWELLYADNLVVIAETEDDLIKRLNEWTK